MAEEILEYIRCLEFRQQTPIPRPCACEPLIMAQETAMRHIWDNPEDEVWNHVPTR